MSGGAPFVGWYGDDFTGATDTLATYAQAGLRALLLTRLPTPAQTARLGPLDALGLAGATRAMGRAEIAATLAPIGPFFAGLGVRVLHYKCCSTFDSAPEVGNLAVALTALRASFPGAATPIIGGQPSLGRYCLFGHLFAAAGAAGDVHRIDRHPTMSRHPSTPMGEADLRLHLQAQGFGRIAAIPYPAYEDAAALRARYDAAADADAALLDVSRQSDLAMIGALLHDLARQAPLLTLGASSVAQALASAMTPAPAAAAPRTRAEGAPFALVGSLSPVTRAQVAAAVSYDKIALDADRLVDDARYGAAQAAAIVANLRSGRPTLAVTGEARSAAATGGAVAAATARLLARTLAAGATRRACVAGGDTSSFAVQGLDAWALAYDASLGPGCPVCALRSDDVALDGVALALKGGQMGGVDYFERFCARRDVAI